MPAPHLEYGCILSKARMKDKGNGKEAEWIVERETDIWKWMLLRKRSRDRGMEQGLGSGNEN